MDKGVVCQVVEKACGLFEVFDRLLGHVSFPINLLGMHWLTLKCHANKCRRGLGGTQPGKSRPQYNRKPLRCTSVWLHKRATRHQARQNGILTAARTPRTAYQP